MTRRPPVLLADPAPSRRRLRSSRPWSWLGLLALALAGPALLAACVPDEETTADVLDEPDPATADGEDDGTPVLPSRVFVQVQAGPDGNLLLDLFAEAGGGCNVSGPYTLDAEAATSGADATVTIIGHGYHSDQGPCDELAVATNALTLPPSVTAGSRIEIVLDDATNEIEIESADDGLLARQREADNVELECPLADQDPTAGCLIDG